MTRVVRAAVAVAVAAAMFAPALGAQDARPFRASADAVRVDVSVQRNGKPVTDLEPADFQIFDNGALQTVVDLSYGRLPIDVTVVLDVSASVNGALLTDLRNAVVALAGRLRPEDRLKLLTFNMRIRRLIDFDAGARIRAIPAGAGEGSGSTSLLDALSVALASDAPIERRQIVLVFSDGRDTSSVTDPDLVIEVARRTRPTVTFVTPPQAGAGRGLGQSVVGRAPNAAAGSDSVWTDPTTGINRAVERPATSLGVMMTPVFYHTIATETGGTVLPMIDQSRGSLAATFNRALEEFRTSYVLHFMPSGPSRKGFHALDVRVKRPERVEVRARRGYVQD